MQGVVPKSIVMTSRREVMRPGTAVNYCQRTNLRVITQKPRCMYMHMHEREDRSLSRPELVHAEYQQSSGITQKSELIRFLMLGVAGIFIG
jgi:hypothetical protein